MPPAGQPQAEPPGRGGWEFQAHSGRPPRYRTVVQWAAAALVRQPRSAIAAFLVTWLNLVPALIAAALGAVLGGLYGGYLGFTGGQGMISEIPLLGYLPTLPANFGLFGGAALGAVIGAFGGFVAGFLGPIAAFAQDQPLRGIGYVVGQLILGLLVALVYVALYHLLEGVLLKLRGARPMSRREAAFLTPIVADVAYRLGIGGQPTVLVHDSREPKATAFARHIVVNRGLLEEFDYDGAVVAGVLAHQLTHWNNADGLANTFVRGMALPLFYGYSLITWLVEVFGKLGGNVARGIATVLLFSVFWPVVVLARLFIRFAGGLDAVPAEYQADQGAVQAGYRDGLRRYLARLPEPVETGMSGWDRRLTMTHPPAELRLERLEDLGMVYPLPDPDGRDAG